jgi:hypothetical protein
MTHAMPLPTPAHRAALTLHALADADRQWLLQGLTGEQKDLLRPLLQELEELGIPRTADLAGIFGDSAGEEVDAFQAVDARSLGTLAKLLAAEPPRVAAAFLARRSRASREPLLRELPSPLAGEIERLMPGVAAARLLQEAVAARLAVQVLQQAPPPSSRSVWQATRRVFRAWRKTQ